jgi:hypothetical protein
MHISVEKLRTLNDGSMTKPQTRLFPGRDVLEPACLETRRSHRLLQLHLFSSSGALALIEQLGIDDEDLGGRWPGGRMVLELRAPAVKPDRAVFAGPGLAAANSAPSGRDRHARRRNARIPHRRIGSGDRPRSDQASPSSSRPADSVGRGPPIATRHPARPMPGEQRTPDRT